MVADTCTLTIDVIKDAGVLPGDQIPEEQKPPADVTDWSQLGNRAVDVYSHCISGERHAGWGIEGEYNLHDSSNPSLLSLLLLTVDLIGEYGGLGVFFWKTRSPKDREIKPAITHIVRDYDFTNGTIEVSKDQGARSRMRPTP